jgi:hypothetical protein
MKSCFPRDGLRAVAETSAEKTIPIPTPDPAREIVASPAPINLADCTSIKKGRVWFA